MIDNNLGDLASNVFCDAMHPGTCRHFKNGCVSRTTQKTPLSLSIHKLNNLLLQLTTITISIDWTSTCPMDFPFKSKYYIYIYTNKYKIYIKRIHVFSKNCGTIIPAAFWTLMQIQIFSFSYKQQAENQLL